MGSLGRAMRRFASRPRLNSLADSVSLISTEPPQVNLPHVDTQLNMHQFNGFFEDGSTSADGLRGRSHSKFVTQASCSFDLVQIPIVLPPHL